MSFCERGQLELVLSVPSRAPCLDVSRDVRELGMLELEYFLLHRLHLD